MKRGPSMLARAPLLRVPRPSFAWAAQRRRPTLSLPKGAGAGGLAVIFQPVVPTPRPYERRRRRSGAKVQIGCNDLQGADLSRRLLHGSMPKPSLIDPVLMGTTS